MSTPYACPSCGTAVGNVRYCPNCGLDFAAAAQQTKARAVPTAQPAAASPRAGLGLLDLISLPLAMAGAFFALTASVLPWISGFGQRQSYWEIAKVEDVLLLLAVLLVMGLAGALLVLPGVAVVRMVALAAIAGLVAFVFTTPLEFIARDIPLVSGKQAGEFLALFAAAMLVTALVLQLVNLRATALPAPDRPAPLLMVGVLLLAVAGPLQPLVELLSVDNGISAWEAYTIADVLRGLLGLALAGLALMALLVPRETAVTAAAFLLGCYTVTDNLVGSVEDLAAGARGAEVFVSLLLLAPLGLAGVALVAIGSPSLRSAPG